MIFYKFNCTDPGLQLGDPAPLKDLSLWTCWYIYIYFFYWIYAFVAKQLFAGSPEQNISGSDHATADAIHVKNQKQAR